jgi:antitoxin ParD1/3/4
MNILLPADLEQLVHEKVRSGKYNCTSEVIQHALWLLKERDQLLQIRLEELRKEIAIGVEQAERGEVVPFDAEAIKAEGRRRLEARRKEGRGTQLGE